MQGLRIAATGRALPSRVVTNEDMAKIVDTSDAWIVSRTGIRQRRFCEGESSADLAARAARQAMERAGIGPEQVCAVVVCTVSPDSLAPSMGCLVQKRLGLPESAACFDLNVGCTGFVYGLQVVRGLLMQDGRKYALLIGAEALSRITDFTDRATCVLFGDGAGCAAVALDDARPYYSSLGARGDEEALYVEGPGGCPPHIHMDGQAVFRFAVEAVPRCVRDLLDQAGLEPGDVDWYVPHQANRRIIQSAAKRLKVPEERFYQNMERYGNTSAASIPIALDEMARLGLLKPGQKVVLVGFGAGLTWGGALLEW